MPLDVIALFEGPRFRRLCFEYARASADAEVSQVLFWATYERQDQRSSTLLVIGDVSPEPFVPPTVTAEEAASALDAITLPEPTPENLRAALALSVDMARYWQEADGADVLAADPGMRTALTRIAAVIAASPHTRWWTTDAMLGDQWAVPWDGGATAQDAVAGELARWRDALIAEEERAAVERPSDPTANWSGTWWSRPPTALVHTTRGLGEDGPAGLWFVEDSLGWESAVATSVLPPSATVVEIDGPDAWIELCRRHPLVVTASRRHDWFRVTGWTGEWVQPDWAAVAHEADGVHLTVAGYLAAATRLLDVGDGRASVIAGWNPDETFWFGRTLTSGSPQEWVRVDDEWCRAAGGRGPEASGDSV